MPGVKPAVALATICAGMLSASMSAGTQPPDRAAQPLVMRVLAFGDRSSLVIELDEPPSEVKSNRIDASNLVVELGPITGLVSPHELKPGAGVPLLLAVYVRQAGPAQARPLEGGKDARRILLRVNFKEGCQAAVRTSGRRVYVDLAAARGADVVAARAPAPADPAGPRGSQAAARGGDSAAIPPHPRDQSAKRPPAVTDLSSLGYQELRATSAETAAAFAKRPDIIGLLALRARVISRDEQLGHVAPDLISGVLADIDQRLEEARRLRLKLDAMEFERAGRGRK